MKTLLTALTTIVLVLTFQSVSLAQSNVSESFKKHFNETVLEVKNTTSPIEKRDLLNESFGKMMSTIDRIESNVKLDASNSMNLDAFRSGLNEKISELNGLEGFDKVGDEELDEFSDYSQDYIEQANRTITIGVTTALLILIILLLL